MTEKTLPKKHIAYTFYIGLVSQADTRLLKAAPTLNTGDFKVSIDGGGFANLATTPTAVPAAGVSVQIDLSLDEMNGDNIVVACIDAAGAEWCDQLILIQPAADTVAGYFGAAATASALATVDGIVDDIHDTDLPAIKADTAAILIDTGTTLDGKIDTIDGIVDAITLKTANIPATPAATGDAMTLTTGALDAILDHPAKGGKTLRQLIIATMAELLGKVTGGGSTAILYYDAEDDTKLRISLGTTDTSGNRAAKATTDYS